MNGKPPRSCGIIEKQISGIIGMIPLIARYAGDRKTARRLASQHLMLTHLGDRMMAAGTLPVDILLPVLNGAPLKDTIVNKVNSQDNPLVGFPLLRWLGDPDEMVIGRRLSSACYVEDALPATLYLALKYHHDVAQGLIANTNFGGDNAGRGGRTGSTVRSGKRASGLSETMGG